MKARRTRRRLASRVEFVEERAVSTEPEVVYRGTWANGREISRAGLLGDTGVFLERYHWQYLHNDGPEHVMAFAPAPSGKGVGLVNPTLLNWTGSAIIHVFKGEKWFRDQRQPGGTTTIGARSRLTVRALSPVVRSFDRRRIEAGA